MSDSLQQSNSQQSEALASPRSRTESTTEGSSSEGSGNVAVMVRARPFNRKELEAHAAVIAEWPDDDTRDRNITSVVVFEGNRVHVYDPEKAYCMREVFDFDHAFWSIPESQYPTGDSRVATQEDLFEQTGKKGVENAMSGYNCCIFAYGQTGSGKTHSMLGNEVDPGISPRLVKLLFETIAKEKFARTQVTVELSFLEIYNEKVKDLLALAEKKSEDYTEVRVRYSPDKGTFVEGLKRLKIEKMEECLEIIKTGMEHRATAATLMNDTSSRSHAIFQICITQKSPLKGTTVRSVVNLVDLAGSERIKMSGVTGSAFTEATNINKSLSTLRRVIDILIDNSKLKKGQRPQVAPYRESLLTWVLSDSLGGNSKTMMVATISPAASNFEDTLNTLRYALKAKAIVCHARVNEEKTATVVHAMRAEMEELRRQLAEKIEGDTAERDRLKQDLVSKEEEFKVMQDEGKKLEELKKQFEQELATKGLELQRAQEQMAELEGVENEKALKAEELELARKLQQETEERLQREEEERAKKEVELNYQLERKDSLRRKHEASIEEENRARVATETVKIRNFAAAFNNAFIIRKQRSDYEDLCTEYNGLRDKITSMEMDIVRYESEMQQLQNDRAYLTRKIESQETRFQTLSRDFSEAVESKTEKIAQLTQKKELTDAELAKASNELARRVEELNRLQRLIEEESAQGKAKTEQLREQIRVLKAERTSKETRLQELNDENATLTKSYEALTKESSAYDAKIERLRQSNTEREAQLRDLERRHEELLQKVADTRNAVMDREQERIRIQQTVETVTDEVSAITRSHEDLKQFVSQRFFPTGRCPPSHVDPKVIAAQANGAEGSSPRVWSNTGYRYQRRAGRSPTTAAPSAPVVSKSPQRQAVRGTVPGRPNGASSALSRSPQRQAAPSNPTTVKAKAASNGLARKY